MFSIINGWAKEKLKSYAGLILILPHIIKKRKRIQLLRKVKDRKIMEYMTARIEFAEVKDPFIALMANPVLELYFWVAKKVVWW